MLSATYSEYLHLDQLLNLQAGFATSGAEASSDEQHFIIVHQVFELWFKAILIDLNKAKVHLQAATRSEGLADTVAYLKRVTKLFEAASHQWQILQSLTPRLFLNLRDTLAPASGSHSSQFREIEVLVGWEGTSPYCMAGMPTNDCDSRASPSSGSSAYNSRRSVPGSLRSIVYDWLAQKLFPQSVDVTDTLLYAYLSALRLYGPACPARREEAEEFLFAQDRQADQRLFYRRVRAGLILIELFKGDSDMIWPGLLVDSLLEVEQQLLSWRFHHARLAEQLIGRRGGTGGSDGVQYLDHTITYRIFPDLWVMRSYLIPQSLLPQSWFKVREKWIPETRSLF